MSKEASQNDIDDILGLKPEEADLNSLYVAPSFESYIFNFKQLSISEKAQLFRNIKDEVEFTKYLDSKSRILSDEDTIFFEFLKSRTPTQLHALYEKQILKSWQINIAISYGVALESLYRYNKMSSGSIDKAIKKGLALLYLYKYQPNFEKKHLKKIASYLERVYGQTVDINNMKVYTRTSPVPEFAHPRTKKPQEIKRYLLENRIEQSVKEKIHKRFSV